MNDCHIGLRKVENASVKKLSKQVAAHLGFFDQIQVSRRKVALDR